jgi:hypothetical protein
MRKFFIWCSLSLSLFPISSFSQFLQLSQFELLQQQEAEAAELRSRSTLPHTCCPLPSNHHHHLIIILLIIILFSFSNPSIQFHPSIRQQQPSRSLGRSPAARPSANNWRFLLQRRLSNYGKAEWRLTVFHQKKRLTACLIRFDRPRESIKGKGYSGHGFTAAAATTTTTIGGPKIPAAIGSKTGQGGSDGGIRQRRRRGSCQRKSLERRILKGRLIRHLSSSPACLT